MVNASDGEEKGFWGYTCLLVGLLVCSYYKYGLIIAERLQHRLFFK